MTVVGEQLQPSLFERSRPGRGGDKIPHPPKDALDRIPVAARRTKPAALPELNEPEVVRHYVNLSQLNYAIDTGFYPLGSCTMKFNPKLNEWAARLPGFASLHPLAPYEIAQGTLQLLFELEEWLAEISGMTAVTLQPAAGAQGELTGILMIRAYHRSRGDTERDEVLVPDSSHGTNPATATMAGFRTITIPSAADGGVDIEAFKAALGPRTAAVMITNPSTLGLFERRIGDLLEEVHAAGALAYMDGANLNAILGRFKPGEAGFDVMHFNVHKTFSTPHGGGGPGAGPVGVGETLLPFLPWPRVLRETDGSFRRERPGERPTSIGRLRSFAANPVVAGDRYGSPPNRTRSTPRRSDRRSAAGPALEADDRTADALSGLKPNEPPPRNRRMERVGAKVRPGEPGGLTTKDTRVTSEEEARQADAALLRRMQGDDLDAFEEFFARYRTPVYRTAYGLTGDPHAAEEVLQDTFARAYQRRAVLRTDVSPLPWLHRVARDLCYSLLARRRLASVPIDASTAGHVVDVEVEPPERAERRELRQIVREGVAALPAKQQGVVVLYYLHGLSLQETATILGIRVGTVKSRLHYALRGLRAHLEGDRRFGGAYWPAGPVNVEVEEA